jgi:hypothetical protein
VNSAPYFYEYEETIPLLFTNNSEITGAESIADASINEDMRVSFMEAGAVKPLVQLLANNNKETVKLPVIRALKNLSLSRTVCQRIEAEGAVWFLINLLKQPEISLNVTEHVLDIIAHILDPSKEMESKFYEGPVNGSKADSRSVFFSIFLSSAHSFFLFF